jgi:hypothetical protein
MFLYRKNDVPRRESLLLKQNHYFVSRIQLTHNTFYPINGIKCTRGLNSSESDHVPINLDSIERFFLNAVRS